MMTTEALTELVGTSARCRAAGHIHGCEGAAGGDHYWPDGREAPEDFDMDCIACGVDLREGEPEFRWVDDEPICEPCWLAVP